MSITVIAGKNYQSVVDDITPYIMGTDYDGQIYISSGTYRTSLHCKVNYKYVDDLKSRLDKCKELRYDEKYTEQTYNMWRPKGEEQIVYLCYDHIRCTLSQLKLQEQQVNTAIKNAEKAVNIAQQKQLDYLMSKQYFDNKGITTDKTDRSREIIIK